MGRGMRHDGVADRKVRLGAECGAESAEMVRIDREVGLHDELSADSATRSDARATAAGLAAFLARRSRHRTRLAFAALKRPLRGSHGWLRG